MTAQAQLLVHADGPGRSGPLGSALARLRLMLQARRPGAARGEVHAPLALSVDDLQGRQLARIDDAGTLTRLRLPAGTCVVTATRGTVRRGYTLTLEPGRSFELHLNHWPEWP